MPGHQAMPTRFMDEAAIRNAVARSADAATRSGHGTFRPVRDLWLDAAPFAGHAFPLVPDDVAA